MSLKSSDGYHATKNATKKIICIALPTKQRDRSQNDHGGRGASFFCWTYEVAVVRMTAQVSAGSIFCSWDWPGAERATAFVRAYGVFAYSRTVALMGMQLCLKKESPRAYKSFPESRCESIKKTNSVTMAIRSSFFLNVHSRIHRNLQSNTEYYSIVPSHRYEKLWPLRNILPPRGLNSVNSSARPS